MKKGRKIVSIVLLLVVITWILNYCQGIKGNKVYAVNALSTYNYSGAQGYDYHDVFHHIYDKQTNEWTKGIAWGDIDKDRVITHCDVDLLKAAIYENIIQDGIIYDLADVAEPYGVIDETDLAYIEGVVNEPRSQNGFPIRQRFGNISIMGASLHCIAGEYTTQNTAENIGIAVGIYTGKIKCIGAPRIMATWDGTGYSTMRTLYGYVYAGVNNLENVTVVPGEGRWIEWRSPNWFIFAEDVDAQERVFIAY